MAACTPDLTNVSMLTPLGFRLTINAQEFRNVEYFCTSANLPSISLPSVSTNYRNIYPNMSGESLKYDPLSITFIVDEELKNYLEIYNWIYHNARENDTKYRDMTLSILTNQNTKNKQVQFMSVIPTSLSAIEFNTQTTEIEYLSCTVEFVYTAFKFL
jgi:hypothetical protein